LITAEPWVLSLLSVLAVSLASQIGLFTLSLNTARLGRLASALVSFAVGVLLGDAFIHLLPETFAGRSSTLGSSLLVLGGVLLFFAVEKLLRHGHGPLHAHPPVVAMNLIGDAIHNFIDGALIGASYLVSPTLGVSTTAAVLLHELPQELGDFGILVHNGLTVRKAALLNLASASLAILGAVVVLLAGSRIGAAVPQLLVPIAAGAFVYIATATLIPELQLDRSLGALLAQATLILAGIAVMGALKLAE
jgi:zinc and cadmium transporter